ncbi:hypothetical protein TNCV_2314901 [Trichonephila clavipes]|nr:hypothetical protein TNCV_2314901 [Trichonephila clavipes]
MGYLVCRVVDSIVSRAWKVFHITGASDKVLSSGRLLAIFLHGIPTGRFHDKHRSLLLVASGSDNEARNKEMFRLSGIGWDEERICLPTPLGKIDIASLSKRFL